MFAECFTNGSSITIVEGHTTASDREFRSHRRSGFPSIVIAIVFRSVSGFDDILGGLHHEYRLKPAA